MSEYLPVETQLNEIAIRNAERLQVAAEVADAKSRQNSFIEYNRLKSDATLRTYRAGLRVFAEFLNGHIGTEIDADALQTNPQAWRNISFGLIDAFKQWMLRNGYSVSSINNRLSAVRVYAKLAASAGTIGRIESLEIGDVRGYAGKEAQRIDERREVTRIGLKKERHTSIAEADLARFREPMDKRDRAVRDAFIRCIMIDMGLRVGEVVRLTVEGVDMERGVISFFRPKVHTTQTHNLPRTVRLALETYLRLAPKSGRLLCGSKRNGKLNHQRGMSESNIALMVKRSGQLLGYERLSPHDFRHSWATRAARSGTDLFVLQEAGGWNSLVMPRRYVEKQKIANQGLKLE
ncbi:MAG: tyrosine-type recombinase/integrase [Candidatus Promineifilaceae bacterium]